ncbi:hypothetical protein QCA50_009127 [Cerrena zonata]|uniref:Ubiquinone biosynthesis O-methyltransferase, mitochondrial n=1 Tax=Cerrena zonata TaxID=2478898 RepID=A0AAW0G2G1_9APHY
MRASTSSRHILRSAKNIRTLHTTVQRQTSLASSSSSSTVNPDEIAHFSRLSAQWWDERGEFGMLHKMNPVRTQFVREKLVEMEYEDGHEDLNEAKVLEGLKVLDVGCGGGLFSESLTRLGANTLGIDASASNIAIASLHASNDPALSFTSSSLPQRFGSSVSHKGKGKLTYEHTSVEDLLAREGPNSFDVVCSMEVVEHVDNPRAFLTSCAEILKPGGHLFLSTIARTPLAYFLTIFSAEQLLRFVTPGTHTWSKYINPSELTSFFHNLHSSSSLSSPSSGEIEVKGQTMDIEVG